MNLILRILVVMVVLSAIHGGEVQNGPTPLPISDYEKTPGKGNMFGWWWDKVFIDNWRDRRAAFWASRQQDQGGVVFAGDSIIQGWDIPANAAPGKIVNHGLRGDTTRGLLFRWKEDVLDLNPAAVVILIGTNDLASGSAPADIASNLKDLLDQLQAWNEKTHAAGKKDKKEKVDKKAKPGVEAWRLPIVVCRVMPRGQASENYAPKVKELNQLIDGVVKGRPATVVCDTYGIYADAQGLPNPADFVDLLHPNAAGYEKWRQALAKAFDELKNPPKR
jgi:lysophospholipase L1-like esterase